MALQKPLSKLKPKILITRTWPTLRNRGQRREGQALIVYRGNIPSRLTLWEQVRRAKEILKRHEAAFKMLAERLASQIELTGQEVIDTLDQYDDSESSLRYAT